MVDSADRAGVHLSAQCDALVDIGDVALAYPYCDMVLRHSRSLPVALLRQLYALGGVGLRRRIFAWEVLLAKARKGGGQRLIVGAR